MRRRKPLSLELRFFLVSEKTYTYASRIEFSDIDFKRLKTYKWDSKNSVFWIIKSAHKWVSKQKLVQFIQFENTILGCQLPWMLESYCMKFSIIWFELETGLAQERVKLFPSFDDWRRRATSKRKRWKDMDTDCAGEGVETREAKKIRKTPSY